MKVIIDNQAGFCQGVLKTIKVTEDLLDKNPNKDIYVLGEIIHNPLEIKRLEKNGLKIAEIADLPEIAKGKDNIVIIRAHGEPPTTYKKAEDLNLQIIDATCARVKHLQKVVAKHYQLGYQIIIFGKYNHPETIGLRGFCNDDCTVIRTNEEAEAITLNSNKILLISQTTMNQSQFLETKAIIEQNIENINQLREHDEKEEIKLTFSDTICKAVTSRENSLIAFAQQCDVIIFVSGRNSSNGKYLYQTALSANPKTFFVETVEEIQKSWLDGAETIGISGATSTPSWYMLELKNAVEQMLKN